MQTDTQILKLIDILKEKGVIRFDKQFCDAIGFSHRNMAKIKNGSTSFQVEHIANIRKVYGANLDYIFGFSDEPFGKAKSVRRVTTVEYLE